MSDKSLIRASASAHTADLQRLTEADNAAAAAATLMEAAAEAAQLARAFADTRLWIFDLDNTLYPAECNLFAQIDQRMSGFIQKLLGLDHAAARKVQKDLYYHYGTTLAGLMAEYGVKPEAFMDYVHDIDLAPVSPMPELDAAIARLEGRKFIFTNGSARHAERVAAKLGVLERFDGIFDIAAGDYVPKPKPESFSAFMRYCEGGDCKAAMFEDLPHNLEAAHALGIKTVLVRSDYIDHPSQHALAAATALPPYIHYETDDLTRFLTRIVGK
ncbi:pyrimidine 5'-nucleotidase [Rhodomicrobium sp. Az07]|uniref:pyrimidine 5'-nucleotidase n=1 Tax=Rhodomicrobium sp. Az07 TaxID=2839034 RepID=UPI002037502D|nr:pyrimidine 5'-nucleotidase [Rhodomicrobium sp. Az07]